MFEKTFELFMAVAAVGMLLLGAFGVMPVATSITVSLIYFIAMSITHLKVSYDKKDEFNTLTGIGSTVIFTLALILS